MKDIIDFTLELRSQDKDKLIPVVTELLQNHMNCNFEWEYEFKENHYEFILTIYNYCWVSNLSSIVNSIPLSNLEKDDDSQPKKKKKEKNVQTKPQRPDHLHKWDGKSWVLNDVKVK